jgi:thioredoxin
MTRCLLAVAAGLLLCGCPESLPSVQGIEVALNSDNFQAEVLESNVPVLVDFGATWCGPCRAMEPVVAQMSLDYQGRLKVGKVDVDLSPGLSAEYGISGIPALILFIDGQEVDRTIGGQSSEDLMAWVDARLPQAALPVPTPATDPAALDALAPESAAPDAAASGTTTTEAAATTAE